MHLDNISLYVWLGTCNLTEYAHPFIRLRNNINEIITDTKTDFHEIVKLFVHYPGCKLTLLEIPPFSIYEWNKKHKHTDSEQFINDDILLYKHIQEINDIIKEINTTLNTRSPCFSNDLHHPINTSKKEGKRALSDQFNLNLYLDSIHPANLLSRVWLRKLSHKIKLDCWQVNSQGGTFHRYR